MIFTDGAFESVDEFQMGNLNAEYYPVGSPIEPPANLGITAFSLNDQMEADGKVQVFARVQNSGLEMQTVGVSLLVDGELADAQQVEVKGINSATLNFDLSSDVSQIQTQFRWNFESTQRIATCKITLRLVCSTRLG